LRSSAKVWNMKASMRNTLQVNRSQKPGRHSISKQSKLWQIRSSKI
jgi:hypothetical protein